MLQAVPTASRWNDLVGPFYSAGQVAKVCGGVSRQALADRRERRTILGLKTADGAIVYPTFQFDEKNRVLSGLPEVLQCFRGVDVDAPYPRDGSFRPRGHLAAGPWWIGSVSTGSWSPPSFLRETLRGVFPSEPRVSRHREAASLRWPPENPSSLEDFPTRQFTAATALFRVVRRGAGPWWFGSSMKGRFDLPEPEGTCYLATDEVTALLEVFGPDLESGAISSDFLKKRGLRKLHLPRSRTCPI